MSEAKAVAKHVRISPIKVRKLIGSIKGKNVEASINKLKFMPQKAARIVGKVLRSAVANADQRAEMDVDTLIVRNIIVDQGPTLKRFRARARGRGSRILKKSSHITVIVSEDAV